MVYWRGAIIAGVEVMTVAAYGACWDQCNAVQSSSQAVSFERVHVMHTEIVDLYLYVGEDSSHPSLSVYVSVINYRMVT